MSFPQYGFFSQEHQQIINGFGWKPRAGQHRFTPAVSWLSMDLSNPAHVLTAVTILEKTPVPTPGVNEKVFEGAAGNIAAALQGNDATSYTAMQNIVANGISYFTKRLEDNAQACLEKMEEMKKHYNNFADSLNTYEALLDYAQNTMDYKPLLRMFVLLDNNAVPNGTLTAEELHIDPKIFELHCKKVNCIRQVAYLNERDKDAEGSWKMNVETLMPVFCKAEKKPTATSRRKPQPRQTAAKNSMQTLTPSQNTM